MANHSTILERIYRNNQSKLSYRREQVVRDLGRINIYFQSLNVQVLEEVAKYDVSTAFLVLFCPISVPNIYFGFGYD